MRVGAVVRRLRAAIRRGFTILEILIAIVVLVLGITGILALFPTAIDSGNKTVEDTYSAAITQSVVDAIAVGLRESRYQWDAGPPNDQVWTYFIFNHDGVIDPAPDVAEDLLGNGEEMWKKDYCVILPRANGVPDPNPVGAKEPVFIYPVPDSVLRNPAANDEGADPDQRNPSGKLASAATSESLVDNFDPKYATNTTVDDTAQLWISRTYKLGRYRDPAPSGSAPGDVRFEYLGEDLVNPSGSTNEFVALDPYCAYSFCFAIKRARVDTNGDGQVSPGPNVRQPSNPPADNFSNSLYELKVMIFKNFNQDAADKLAPTSAGVPSGGPGTVVPKTNVPIKTFITLISI